MPEAPRLILASASPRRRELLSLLRVPFEVVPSAYEEQLPDSHPDPAGLAVHLAAEKALDVTRRLGTDEAPRSPEASSFILHPSSFVLGADTVVALENRVYGKPADVGDAARMLRELSGRTHAVVTGVALAAGDTLHRFAVRTSVRFRELEEAEILAYCETGEPMDKAGAYAIQGYGAILIEGIEGDYPNVVGLPLTPLALLLRDLGMRVLGIPREGE